MIISSDAEEEGKAALRVKTMHGLREDAISLASDALPWKGERPRSDCRVEAASLVAMLPCGGWSGARIELMVVLFASSPLIHGAARSFRSRRRRNSSHNSRSSFGLR